MYLEFEKPAAELFQKIQELRALGGVGIVAELGRLERKLVRLRKRMISKLTPMEVIQLARHPLRPYAQDYIAGIFEHIEEIHGDRRFGDDRAIFAGFGALQGRSFAVLGQKKGRTTQEKIAVNFGMPMPEGFRKAQRLMSLAERFNLPIVSFVDTPGAFPGIEAEERGQAEAIASTIEAMLKTPVPTISIIVGEGGSGGALALSVADRLLMLEFSVFSVISPEGCASILFRESNKESVQKAAGLLKLTAKDLMEYGLVDGIIPEPEGGAHWDKEKAIALLNDALQKELKALLMEPLESRINKRQEKFFNMGQYATRGHPRRP